MPSFGNGQLLHFKGEPLDKKYKSVICQKLFNQRQCLYRHWKKQTIPKNQLQVGIKITPAKRQTNILESSTQKNKQRLPDQPCKSTSKVFLCVQSPQMIN